MKKYPLLSGSLITVVFSIILSINILLMVGDVLNDAGLPEIFILMIDFTIRFLSGAICVIAIIPLILYFSLNKKILKTYARDDINFLKGISYLKASVIGIISSLIFFIICLFMGGLLGVLNLDFSLIFDFPTEGKVGWFIFIYALIPALWEEMTFRGVILHSVKEKYSDKYAILVSSLLFGLFHFTSLLYEPLDMAIFYFMMSTLYGIAWGYLVVKSGNVIPGIIAHYMIDAFGMPFLNVASTSQSAVGIFFLSISWLYPIVTILAFHYFFRKRINFQFPK